MAQARSSNDMMLQKARDFITRCKTELKWEDMAEDVVMDIGCGVFFYCTRAVFEKCPEVGCVLAIDKCPDVLTNEIVENELLKERFRHSIVQFHAVDILDSLGLEPFKGHVDKIVCKDTLQQIADKMTAFQNMYNILMPGGSAGILFCLLNPVGLWQSVISMHENWRQYRKNVPLSFFLGSLEEDYYKNMLKALGFVVVKCEKNTVPLAFFNEKCCLRELMPIGQSILDIPPERMTEFQKDSVNIFKELIGHCGGGPMCYHASELFLLVAKPL